MININKKSIAIFYGTNTGNTENIAYIISNKLNINNIFDISKCNVNLFNKYDYIIMGTSTWFYGELQYDWKCKISEFKNINFNNKFISFFACGDQLNYSDNFCDGIYYIYYRLIKKNKINLIGKWDNINYKFNKSKSILKDNKFIGLVLDIDNQNKYTEERISIWTENIKNIINIY